MVPVSKAVVLLKVVKFGGSSVASGEKIGRAAKAIVQDYEGGSRIVVVVAAMGDSTDRLLAIANEACGGSPAPEDLDEILAMGERISIRMFAAALHSLGAKPVVGDPQTSLWPVITDSTPGSAKPDLAKSAVRARETMLPLLEEGKIPVVAGFIGIDGANRITTIGRGGGDTSASLMGNVLHADEVVIVTDVDGILSADPRVVPDARILERITVQELWDLAVNGAGVMHHLSLRYKREGTVIRVVNNEKGDIMIKGTKITGELESVGILVGLSPEPKAAVTVVGDRMDQRRGLLYKFSQQLSEADVTIYSISASTYSITFYVDESMERNAVARLHELVVEDDLLKAVTSRGGIGLITVAAQDLQDKASMLSHIGTLLEEQGHHLIGVNTSTAELTLLVEWEQAEACRDVLRSGLAS